MTFIGQGINKIFDLLVWPLAGMPAMAMLILSLLTAVVGLLIFKWATPQQHLSGARDRLLGHIYEMGLYQDHLSVLARIQGSLAVANLKYLRLTFPALVALMVPMVVTVVQLESRFAHRPFAAGETTLFSVEVEEENAARIYDITLVTPTGVTVEAGPVRSLPSGSVTWRLRVDDPEAGPLQVRLDGKEVAVRIMRPTGRLPRLNETSGTGFLDPILSPGVAPLAAKGILSSMTLLLPERHTSYLGLDLNWLVAFCVFSLLGGLLLKDTLKVSL